METIEIQLPTTTAYMLAIVQGWEPMIEDTSQEMVGDQHPLIPNPMTYQQFISTAAPGYLTQIVLNKGKEKVMEEFKSIYDSIEDSLKRGEFDEMILLGDIPGIKAMVRDSL